MMQIVTTPNLFGVPRQAYTSSLDVSTGEMVYLRVRDGIENILEVVSVSVVGELYLPLLFRQSIVP